MFGIRRNFNSTICPVNAIEEYMVISRQLQIDLTTGYLFRATTPQGGVIDAPFSSSAAEARLKVYLKEMGADDGETLHGFRSGFGIGGDHGPRSVVTTPHCLALLHNALFHAQPDKVWVES